MTERTTGSSQQIAGQTRVEISTAHNEEQRHGGIPYRSEKFEETMSDVVE